MVENEGPNNSLHLVKSRSLCSGRRKTGVNTVYDHVLEMLRIFVVTRIDTFSLIVIKELEICSHERSKR